MVIHNGGVLWPILAFFATFNTLRNRCNSGASQTYNAIRRLAHEAIVREWDLGRYTLEKNPYSLKGSHSL